jgi:hypothetical protein
MTTLGETSPARRSSRLRQSACVRFYGRIRGPSLRDMWLEISWFRLWPANDAARCRHLGLLHALA